MSVVKAITASLDVLVAQSQGGRPQVEAPASRSWERSPKWKRERELHKTLEEAEKDRAFAGKGVLLCVELGQLAGEIWDRHCDDYLSAVAARDDAFARWHGADRTFKKSRAGRDYARWRARLSADPIAREATPAPEETPA